MALKTTKEHRDAVSARLREYEAALREKPFRGLDFCDICTTVVEDGPPERTGCWRCLLHSKADGTTCRNEATNLYGAQCRTPEQLRAHFKYLLGQLDKNGYEFK